MIFFFVFAAIPSVLLGFSCPLFTVFPIIADPKSGSFGKAWVSVFRADMVFPFLVGILFAVFVSAWFCSTLVVHIKIGRFSVPKVTAAINNNFLSCVKRLVALAVFLLFEYTVFVLFDVLWDAVLPDVGAVIASALTFAVIALFLSATIASICLWLPTMVMTGQPFGKALLTAFYRSKKLHVRYLHFYLFLDVVLLGFATAAYYCGAYPVLARILTSISYTIVFVLAHVYWFLTFCEENSIAYPTRNKTLL